MFETSTKYGIVVGIDGSPESDAAVQWATREGALRGEPITLMHVVQPVVASWPVSAGELRVTEWQENNARRVVDQALVVTDIAVNHSEPRDVRTEILHA